jgi:hypothetical protein
MSDAVVARRPTTWVVQGAESVPFRVSRTRKVTRQEEW